MQWSRIKPFEKNRWSRAPNFPIRSSGGPNFIIARVCNLPIASSRAQINVPLRNQGPNFPFSSSGHLAPSPSFQYRIPLRHQMAKGPIFSTAPSRAPNFHQETPIVTSSFPSRYQGVPFIIASSKGLIYHNFASSRAPISPHRVINGTQISKIHYEICTD